MPETDFERAVRDAVRTFDWALFVQDLEDGFFVSVGDAIAEHTATALARQYDPDFEEDE